jgi:hypothetical protein
MTAHQDTDNGPDLSLEIPVTTPCLPARAAYRNFLP